MHGVIARTLASPRVRRSWRKVPTVPAEHRCLASCPPAERSAPRLNRGHGMQPSGGTSRANPTEQVAGSG